MEDQGCGSGPLVFLGPMNPPVHGRPHHVVCTTTQYFLEIINEEIPLSANSSAMPGVNIRTSAMYGEGRGCGSR